MYARIGVADPPPASTHHLPLVLILTAMLGGHLGAADAAPRSAARAAIANSIGVQLLTGPSASRTDPRSRIYIADHLRPGAVIHRQVAVSNTTAGTMHIAIYAAAATIGHGIFVGAAGHSPNDLSNWTSVSPTVANIPAGGRTTATVTIAVPHDASPGERYGVVWAETRSAPPAGSGITFVNRVGIRIYLSVGPGGPPPSRFTIDSLTATRAPDGQPRVVAAVHNTGGRALDMSGTLQLSAGPGGSRAGPFPAILGVTLAVGATEPVTITLGRGLPDGPWNALMTLHSGLTDNHARATITFPRAEASSFPYPAVAGLIVLLLLVIAATSVIVGRRFRA